MASSQLSKDHSRSGDLVVLILLALSTVVLHTLTGNRYGFHRDELATLDDARYLAWGYVAYPPVAPFIGRVALALFGPSVAGVRFFAALALSVVLVLTGLMARELGGSRLAQIVALTAIAPIAITEGALFQYVAFDTLWWVVAAYSVIRLLKSDNPQWWLAIGAAIGLGMMTKYTMIFLSAGIVLGLLLTPVRRYLGNAWLWCGVLLAVLIFLPNLIWQIRHNFISLDFLQHIHARDVRLGRTNAFLTDQFRMTLFAAPLWIAGLVYCFAVPEGKRYRMIGWMYAVPLLLFIVAKGRGYYLAPAYPMLFAAGSVWGERWLATLTSGWAKVVKSVTWSAIAADAIISAALTLPIAPVNSAWWAAANHADGDLREEIGWPELVETIAKIRNGLTADERDRIGILAENYGEAGAIDMYGPAYGLPKALGGVNSYWLRGYGDPPPQTLIVIGLSREDAEQIFQSCELAGHNTNRYGIANEESADHPEIFVCRNLLEPWPEFWKRFKRYG